MSLLSDSPLVSELGQKPFRLFYDMYHRILRDGLKTYIQNMAALSHTLVSNLTIMGDGSTTGAFLDQFKDTPIYREYLYWYRTADVSTLRYIYTFLTFGKKLWYVDEELNSIAFRDWNNVEEKLSALDLNSDYIPWLRDIMRALIDPSDYTLLYPKFGPGSVYEKGLKGVISKSNKLRYNARLERAFFRSHFVDYGLRADQGFSRDKFFLGMAPDAEGDVDVDIARLRFVPKTTKTARSICMESNTRMCFQQAYLRLLLQKMDNDVCRRFINFEDQSRNRYLSEYGSYSSEIDTIDLSAASDSVHVDLVRSIFPRRELYFLLATRSSIVDIGNMGAPSLRKVKKFAPMGSALCFPVQSLIFTSVVILSSIICANEGRLPDRRGTVSVQSIRSHVDRHFARSVGYRPPHWNLFQPASVYGDDICVDRRLTPYVTSILTDLGFSVNSDKSFSGSQAFRESCGGYYWQGHDITPLYFRVPYHRKPGAEVMMSAVSLANSAGDRGYRNLNRYLTHYLLDEFRFVRFSSDRLDSGSIYSTCVRNSHLRTRYNSDLQRDEVLGLAVVPSKYKRARREEKLPLESYLYLRWSASRVSGFVPDDISSASRHDPSGARLTGRWMPRQ